MRTRLIVVLAVAISMPAHAGPDSKRIDAVMKEWARKDSPGCAAAVIQNRKIVHAKGYGVADLERSVPITPKTVFDIGSTSKQFTASAILLLAADGKLRLDDDVRKYVPELPALGKTPTTIRHLLHHTGGLRDYMALLMLGGAQIDGVVTVRETIAVLARQKALEFEPGTKQVYSNTGYFTLAQIVERATKQTMARFVGDRIFKPLGMSSTLILDDHTRVVPGRAIGYSPKDDGGWRLDMSGWEQTGDGAVLTTVLDLATWDANFYDPKVGGKPLIDGLHQRGTLAGGQVLDYAAGLVHGTYRGQATVSHGGAWAGYRAQLERYPALRTSVIVLCNAGNSQPDQLARKIADVVLGKQLAKAAIEPTPSSTPAVELKPAELGVWVGTYREGVTGAVVSVTRAGDALALEGGGQTFALAPTSKRTFKLGPTPIVVELDGVAPRRKLAVRDRSFEEKYDEITLHALSSGELAGYAGRYRSDEANTEWTLAVKNGALVATGRGLDNGVLVGSVEDEFSIASAGVTLRFSRDTRGVTGFVAGAGSVQGIRFDKVP